MNHTPTSAPETRTPLHTIRWVIDRDGFIRGIVTCAAPRSAPCHTQCGGDCETWQPSIDGDRCASCGSALVHPDACAFVEWVDAESAEGLFGGTDDTPLRDGPIDFTWNDDLPSWAYTAAVES